MKDRFIVITILALLSLTFVFVNGCAGGTILSVKHKKIIQFDQMIQEVKDKKIILLGELHSEPKHHKHQLRVIKALYEKGIPIAVGLEMFRTNDQKELDKWVSGKVTLDEFLPVYYDNWNLPWSIYRDIFLFSQENKIPLIGLNIPMNITNKIAQKGFSSLTKEELQQLPEGISCNVDSTYMKFIERTYSYHNRGKDFINFCQAQIVWDSAMALYTIKYLEKKPGSTLVLLTGTGHAWKRAIPQQIMRLNIDYSISVILPEIPNRIEKDSVTVDDADFLILQ